MRATLIQTLQKNGIKAPGIQGSDKLRLCFMGPSGGGKSDFINSILSEFQYRIITLAETGISHEAPTTARLKVYQPQHKRDGPGLNIELIDTMGFRADTCGILTDDIPTVLDGKVSNNAAFSPSTPLPQPDCDSPSPARSMHLLALVVDGSKFACFPRELITKMKSAIDCAKQREIPRVVLITHIDKVCTHVAQNPSEVYRSQQLKQCIENVKQELQIKLVDILPIYNYSDSDTELDWRKSALVLQALTHQVSRIQDHFGPMTPSAQSAKKKGWSPFSR